MPKKTFTIYVTAEFEENDDLHGIAKTLASKANEMLTDWMWLKKRKTTVETSHIISNVPKDTM